MITNLERQFTGTQQFLPILPKVTSYFLGTQLAYELWLKDISFWGPSFWSFVADFAAVAVVVEVVAVVAAAADVLELPLVQLASNA
jgi:hypothetical protein